MPIAVALAHGLCHSTLLQHTHLTFSIQQTNTRARIVLTFALIVLFFIHFSPYYCEPLHASDQKISGEGKKLLVYQLQEALSLSWHYLKLFVTFLLMILLCVCVRMSTSCAYVSLNGSAQTIPIFLISVYFSLNEQHSKRQFCA